jgi:hypothetical protein
MVNRARHSVMTHDIDMKEIVKAGYFDIDASYYEKLKKIIDVSKKESSAGIEVPNDTIGALLKPVNDDRQISLTELEKIKNGLKKQIIALKNIGGDYLAEIVRQYNELSFKSKLNAMTYLKNKEFELEAVEALISFIKGYVLLNCCYTVYEYSH